MSVISVAALRRSAWTFVWLGLCVAASAVQSPARPLGELLHQYRFGDPDPAIAEFAQWPDARVRREAGPGAAGGDAWTLATLALMHDEAAHAQPVSWRERTVVVPDILDQLHRLARVSTDPALRRFVRDLHLEHLWANGGRDLAERRFPDDPIVHLRIGADREWAMPIVLAGGRRGWSNVAVPVWSNEHGQFSHQAERAVFNYRRALEIVPNLVEARTRLGRVLWLTGRRDEAERELLRARQDAAAGTASGPDGYLAALFLGRLYEHDDLPERASQWYRAAVDSRPEGQAARLALARMAIGAGRLGEARRAVGTAFGPESGLRAVDPWTRYDVGPGRAARIRALRSQLPGVSVPPASPPIGHDPEVAAPIGDTDRLASGQLRIAIVVDTSDSIRVGESHPGALVARAVLRARRVGDVVSLLTFDDRIELRVPPTLGTAALETAATAIGVDARPDAALRSTVWDAVLAAGAVTAGADVPTLVLLVSDGLDNASWHARDEVADVLSRAGVVVDLVSVPARDNLREWHPPGSPWPEWIAARTGGKAYGIRDLDRIGKRISAVRSPKSGAR